MPIANAILTTDNEAQAEARAEEKGREAARVAVEMANLLNDYVMPGIPTSSGSVPKATRRAGARSRRRRRAPAQCGAPPGTRVRHAGRLPVAVSREDAASIQAHDGRRASPRDRPHFEALLAGASARLRSSRRDRSRISTVRLRLLRPVEQAILTIACYELRDRLEIPYAW